MPQFIITGHDGKDAGAPARRMAHRPAHIAHIEQTKARGEMLCACALLDSAGNMCGSLIVLNVENRAAVDAWLAQEPFVTGEVWQDIQLQDARLADAFKELLP